MPGQVKHFLFAVVTRERMIAHAYMMAPDGEEFEVVLNLMMDDLEKRQLHPLTTVLATALNSDGVELVRDIVVRCNPPSKALLDEATDFHISAWVMSDDEPLSQRLMELH